MNRLRNLRAAGTAIWLDTLSRELLDDGGFERLEHELAITGATSNPTIFEKAICGSDAYDAQLRELLDDGVDDTVGLFTALAVEDVRRAARLLRPVHLESDGLDGYVSLECTPDVAHDTAATVEQATDLWQRLDMPNVMIKVPATDAGVGAIEALTAAGVNVNVTLLFSVDRYEQVIEAYLRGLERRVRGAMTLHGIRSVASFFVSRVDAKVDALLAADSPLLGRVGIANARTAYGRYCAAFRGPRWERLEQLGALPQRPLWASTATKNPAYRDVMYLERLALPDTILTVPEATLRAFADHGSPDREAALRVDGARYELAAAGASVDLPAIAQELEKEGVEAFAASYTGLLECVADRVRLVATRSGSHRPRDDHRPVGRPHEVSGHRAE